MKGVSKNLLFQSVYVVALNDGSTKTLTLKRSIQVGLGLGKKVLIELFYMIESVKANCVNSNPNPNPNPNLNPNPNAIFRNQACHFLSLIQI